MIFGIFFIFPAWDRYFKHVGKLLLENIAVEQQFKNS